MTIRVTKRNGQLEPVDLNKIHRVLTWGAEGLDVSISQVEIESKIQFVDGMSTKDIHDLLIDTAANLVSEETPEYGTLAARLGFFAIRKEAFGSFEPPSLGQHIHKMVKANRYDASLLYYTPSELDVLNDALEHTRDLNYGLPALKEFQTKYLVQDRRTGRVFESPQFLYMCQAMTKFNTRCATPDNSIDLVLVNKVISYYEATSTHWLSEPTPIMAGVRTPVRQFSSCVKIELGDSIDSITQAKTAIVKYVSQKAGIGINVGENRGLGAEIRGGDTEHTGLIPFIKSIEADVHCCSQGGVRKGSATVYFPWWHYEFPELIVLKNNKGTDEKRARHLDYGVQINKFLLRKVKENATVYLFSPHDAPGLYEAFFADQDKFATLYEQYASDPLVRKRETTALDLMTSIALERNQTNRIYTMNVDSVNEHSPFDPSRAPIRMSNLCAEIAIPTTPLSENPNQPGEIALCTLGAFNLGMLDLKDVGSRLKAAGYIALMVESLDNLLSYQDYPMAAARLNTDLYRPLGIGVINFAYYLAKNGVRYSDGSANQLVHDTFEFIKYHALKASVELAKLRGPCSGYKSTRYAQGIMCIDTYNREVDALVPAGNQLSLDWESLRADIAKYGVRNATLLALMPSETSSRISGATNGIEPPLAAFSYKPNKKTLIPMLVPEYDKLDYEFAWDIPNNKGYLDLVAIMQKFVCQAISANTYYDPSKYPNNKIPVKTLIQDIFYAHKIGVKTLYYQNTRDGQKDSYTVENSGCDGGACMI